MEMIAVFVGIFILCYLIGGVNGAILMSKLLHHEDIREKGSGNPGFTNYKRVYGMSFAAAIVMMFDIVKTAIPVALTMIVTNNMWGIGQFGAAFAGLACMLGHCFPVWYKFKGGKAFMAGFATIWFVDWRMALIASGVFFIVLFSTWYMSVSSCAASLTCPVALAFLHPASVWVLVLSAVSALLVIVRHASNFKKLAQGTESKFTIGHKKA